MTSVAHLDAAGLLHELGEWRLADGGHHHVAGDGVLRIGHRQQALSTSLHLHRIEQQRPCSSVRMASGWRRHRNCTPSCLAVLVFEVEGRHVAARRGDRGDRPSPRPGRRAALAASMAVLPAPTTTTVPVSSRRSARSCTRQMSSSAFITPLASSPGIFSRCMAPRPTPRKIKSNSSSSAASVARRIRSRRQSGTPRPCGESSRSSRRLSAARSLYSATP